VIPIFLVQHIDASFSKEEILKLYVSIYEERIREELRVPGF
tara:strand:- start:6049 stop:6171 length:123 start_codon:yes stop_codon:yes gene_type:complete